MVVLQQFIQSVWWRTSLWNGITCRWRTEIFGGQSDVAFNRTGRVTNRSRSRRRISNHSTYRSTFNSLLFHVCCKLISEFLEFTDFGYLKILIYNCIFQGIAVCVWTLVMEEMTGIYVMLLFLDETLNFGQGIFVLVIFGLEPRRFLAPFWSG